MLSKADHILRNLRVNHSSDQFAFIDNLRVLFISEKNIVDPNVFILVHKKHPILPVVHVLLGVKKYLNLSYVCPLHATCMSCHKRPVFLIMPPVSCLVITFISPQSSEEILKERKQKCYSFVQYWQECEAFFILSHNHWLQNYLIDDCLYSHHLFG